jgi:hypothetical protein
MTAMSAPLTTPADDEFLRGARLGIFTTASHPGRWPLSVPVWFEWSGGRAQLFSGAAAPKVSRLRDDPGATLLATNHVGEAEHWVALDGTVEIATDGVGELIERLTPRYWDLSVPGLQATLDTWRASLHTLVRLVLTPQRGRRG